MRCWACACACLQRLPCHARTPARVCASQGASCRVRTRTRSWLCCTSWTACVRCHPTSHAAGRSCVVSRGSRDSSESRGERGAPRRSNTRTHACMHTRGHKRRATHPPGGGAVPAAARACRWRGLGLFGTLHLPALACSRCAVRVCARLCSMQPDGVVRACVLLLQLLAAAAHMPSRGGARGRGV